MNILDNLKSAWDGFVRIYPQRLKNSKPSNLLVSLGLPLNSFYWIMGSNRGQFLGLAINKSILHYKSIIDFIDNSKLIYVKDIDNYAMYAYKQYINTGESL